MATHPSDPPTGQGSGTAPAEARRNATVKSPAACPSAKGQQKLGEGDGGSRRRADSERAACALDLARRSGVRQVCMAAHQAALAAAAEERRAQQRTLFLPRAATVGRIKSIELIPHARTLANVIVECVLADALSPSSSSSSSSSSGLCVSSEPLGPPNPEPECARELAFLAPPSAWQTGDLALVFCADRDFYLPPFPETRYLARGNLVSARNRVSVTFQDAKLRFPPRNARTRVASRSHENSGGGADGGCEPLLTYFSAGLLGPLTWATENVGMFVDLGHDASPYLERSTACILEWTGLLSPIVELVFTFLGYVRLAFGADLTAFFRVGLEPCVCGLCTT